MKIFRVEKREGASANVQTALLHMISFKGQIVFFDPPVERGIRDVEFFRKLHKIFFGLLDSSQEQLLFQVGKIILQTESVEFV